MTLGGNETDPAKKRSIRWKERFSRKARQQEEEGLQQQHISLPSDATSKRASSSISSHFDNSDNFSIHSGSSIEIPYEASLNGLPLTKAQLSRNKDLHENFKQVPLGDTLLHDFKCALQKDVLLQGRLYLTKNYVCFKSNILGYITTVELKIEDIKHLDRVRTLRFMPRVIQLTMKNDDKYTFTSFLSSLSARDEAYDSLTGLWLQDHSPTAPSSVASSVSSVLSSATTIPSALSPSTTSPEKLPPALILPDNNTDHKGSDVIDTLNSNACIGTPSTASPNSPGHFKIFHRRRAQTVSAQNIPSARERSATSSSTPLVKHPSNHITWLDDRQENTTAGETKSTASFSRSSSKSSILKKQRKTPTPSSSSPPSISQDHNPNNNRSLTRTNVTTIFAVGAFVLLISHLILTYEFYHVTQQLTIQQQQQQQQKQQHYPSRSSPQQKQPLQNTAWISGKLQDVKNQAQMWEQETLRQRKKLLDLIPS